MLIIVFMIAFLSGILFASFIFYLLLKYFRPESLPIKRQSSENPVIYMTNDHEDKIMETDE